MSQPVLPMEVALPQRTVNTTTFVDNMRMPVHRWFRYSAGFSAEWAASVIKETNARRVLDPFGGSGTTVVAAEAAGVEGVGVDVHPFVSRVAKAKLAWRADPDVLLKRAHEDQTHHVGKVPTRRGGTGVPVKRQVDVARLRKELARAVEAEDYERAAKLRDQIKQAEA